MEDSPLILLGSVFLLLMAVLAIGYFVNRASIKQENASLDRQISEQQEKGGSYVESMRIGSSVSVSLSTKELIIADGERVYDSSEIKSLIPKASSGNRSSSIYYSLNFVMTDGLNVYVECNSLKSFLNNIVGLCVFANRNLVDDKTNSEEDFITSIGSALDSKLDSKSSLSKNY